MRQLQYAVSKTVLMQLLHRDPELTILGNLPTSNQSHERKTNILSYKLQNDAAHTTICAPQGIAKQAAGGVKSNGW